MAIFGKIDAATFSNNVAVTNGDATVTKNAADTVAQGDILELGGVAYVVAQVTSTTAIELHKAYAGSTNAALSGAVRRTAPKAVAEFVVKGGDSRSRDLIFVDATEQAVAANKSRGIWGPGWWLYETYTTAAGDTRHKAECLAFVHATAAAAGDDADDAIAADVAVTITIGTQPASVGSIADGATTSGILSIAATPSAGGSSVIEFQWQKQSPTSKRWVNMGASDNGMTFGTGTSGGAKTGQMNAASIAKSTWDGYKFRVKVTTTNGAKEVISDTATLTFA